MSVAPRPDWLPEHTRRVLTVLPGAKRDAGSVEQGVDLVPVLVAGVAAGEDSYLSDVGGRAATPRGPAWSWSIPGSALVCGGAGIGRGSAAGAPDDALGDALTAAAPTPRGRAPGPRGTGAPGQAPRVGPR
jgi:hypothetical protein